MNIEELRDYCINIKGAAESFPFDEKTIVFKVMDKMFVYTNLEPKDGIFRLNMKSDPEISTKLRDQYEGINRCTHTKSLMWHAINLGSDVPDNLIKQLITHSVEEVIKKLSKKKQEEYSNLNQQDDL